MMCEVSQGEPFYYKCRLYKQQTHDGYTYRCGCSCCTILVRSAHPPLLNGDLQYISGILRRRLADESSRLSSRGTRRKRGDSLCLPPAPLRRWLTYFNRFAQNNLDIDERLPTFTLGVRYGHARLWLAWSDGCAQAFELE